MPLTLMLTWWNLIFIVPFALAVIYLGLFVLTGMTFGDTDVDADVDADADVDGDVDTEVSVDAHVVDADMDHDVDHDVEADHDADADHDAPAHSMPHGPAVSVDADPGAHVPLHWAILSMLGVGKIPLSLALMIFALCWGFLGLVINMALSQWLGPTALVALFSLPLALMGSMALTGLCAAGLARVFPNKSAGRNRRSDLVGKSGEAIYDIDGTFGMATVRGEAGDFYQIPCRTADNGVRIPKGSRIVIFEYDRDSGVFHVAPFNA